VTPEVEAYLRKSRETLERATYWAEASQFFGAVARDAYLAAFQAAQAIILARTDKVGKTHSGVRSEMERLGKGDPQIAGDFATFLARAYVLKEKDDYVVGPDRLISKETALSALATATRLVAHTEWLLAQPEPPTAG
jgi:uncharacterized protein (UPF0332 family)